MILVDTMKNLKIYRTQMFLPTIEGDKKRKSAILLLTPNYQSSKNIMNNPLFINKMRYMSYYLDKDVSYYINSKELEKVEESDIKIENYFEVESFLEMSTAERKDLADTQFGLPEKRKYPLDSEDRVRSAIKFFNYCSKDEEEELAKNINKAISKFNISDIKVGKKNRFSNYCNESIKESVLVEAKRINDDGETVPDKCPDCGSDIKVMIKGEPVFLCSNEKCKKYFGTVPFKESSIDTNSSLKFLPESCINTGDKIIFFNEDSSNDVQLRRLLYNDRIRQRKEVLKLYDTVKEDLPFIKYTYAEIERYQKKNLFVDLYYYNSLFFQNNSWALQKGMRLYSDFMSRLLNNPNLKNNGYENKTIFIPVADWDLNHDNTVWNFRACLNPISVIYQMMLSGMLPILQKTFGNSNIIFVGKNNYFKLNFSEFDVKELKASIVKFKLFLIKICKNEEFDYEDIDTSTDNTSSHEVIKANIIDKIETSKGIDLTSKVASVSKKINNPKDVKKIDDKSEETEDVDAVISKATLNMDDINDVDRDADIEKLAQTIAFAGDNSSSEDDAMDILDTDEIKQIVMSLGNDDKIDISASRASRILDLDKKLLDTNINGKSIKDILNDTSSKEPIKTSLNIATPVEGWKDLTYVNFDKNYNIDKDIVSCFRHFENVSRPISIVDIDVSNNSTSENRVNLYNVSMEDYRGKRFTLKLDIPIMKDNRFLLGGNYKSIQSQFFNMPIIKTDQNTCQIISNYKKIFISLYNTASGRSLPLTARFLKAVNKYKGKKIKFFEGNNSRICKKYNLLIDYIDLAGSLSRIETDTFIIYFNQDEIRNLYSVDESKGVPYIYYKNTKDIGYISNEKHDADFSFIKIILGHLFDECADFKDIFLSTTRATSCMYSRASIMSSKIPLIVICAYHEGLRKVLDKAGIKYNIKLNLSKEDRSNLDLDWIKFKDGYLTYDVSYTSSILLNGLKVCSTELFELSEIDNKNMYLEFLDNFGGRIKADGLDNFYDLMLDPMTIENLIFYNFPTDYISILLYGNALLADNKYIRHGDTSSRKVRRYALVAAYTYLVLSEAYGLYANQLKHSRECATMIVKQSAVIDKLLTDTISSDDSCINALRDVETTNAITTKGPSGMNEERAYSLDKRTYDDSMLNTLGMSTGFAGNVGITRQTTINANIDQDGYVKNIKGDTSKMNTINSLTVTEALTPFGSTRDNPMRTAMTFIQTAKHMVRTEESDPLLVTSGIDEAMPYLTTDKFAFKSKQDGIVEEVNDEFMILKYADGTKEYINLKETIEKNSDGGYFVPLKLDKVDKIKAGSKIFKDQILAYDKYSFSNSVGESDNIAYNIGKLAKVAIINTDEGFEDSGIISESMAKKLATRINLMHDHVIDKESIVVSIAKVGDHVECGDNLLVWQSPFDDSDANELMKNLIDANSSDLGKQKITSKVTGVVKDIKIYRTVEIDNLSDSLKKIVSNYEAPLNELEKKLKSNNIDISQIPAHYILPATGKLKRAQDAILIEIYVEYLDTVGIGDKIVYYSANKAVEKNIFPEGKEPYTDFRPNEIIDAFVSEISIDHRQVTSTLTTGSLNKLMIELDRSIKTIMGIKFDDTTV